MIIDILPQFEALDKCTADWGSAIAVHTQCRNLFCCKIVGKHVLASFVRIPMQQFQW